MRTYEALAVLLAAGDGSRWRLFKKEEVQRYKDQAKSVLRGIGLTTAEIEGPFPLGCVQEGLYLIDQHPAEFIRQCREAEEWHNQRN
jgi:hypothetical protein